MNPRQAISSAPYAVTSMTALTAADATNLGGTPASGYVKTNDTRLSDARIPTAGSADYVQNTTTQQSLSNFNISGTGKANILEATTQFNIGGSRVLSIGNSGTNNVFVGKGAGESAAVASSNTAVGFNAGKFLSTGSYNALLGTGAGFSLSTQTNNSFFGGLSGINTLGTSNSFFGYHTGETNSGGSNNTLLGAGSDLVSPNLMNATAIGANTIVGASNAIVIGNSSNRVGIGTTTPTTRLEVAAGDLFVSDSNFGIIMKSPNGTCYRLKIDNSGALTSAVTACPLP
jgi:hypothetical protein